MDTSGLLKPRSPFGFLFYILLSISITAPTLAKGLITDSSCDESWETEVYFSNHSKPDKLIIDASGSPCIAGNLIFRIVSSKGKKIYRKTTRIKSQYVDPGAIKVGSISETINSLLDEAQEYTGKWPKYVGNGSASVEPGEFAYHVTKQDYNKLVQRNIPALHIITHYEADIHLIYDEKKKKALVIWESWL
jgi:hypothetical protein